MQPGVALLEAAEGEPILETALIVRTLRPVFLSHEGGPISPELAIHETGFLCPSACAFFGGNRLYLLLEPAPCDACHDVARLRMLRLMLFSRAIGHAVISCAKVSETRTTHHQVNLGI
jgi:hypothetical protein